MNAMLRDDEYSRAVLRGHEHELIYSNFPFLMFLQFGYDDHHALVCVAGMFRKCKFLFNVASFS